MNKILLVIQREYVTRVRNKTFILSTFLLPIFILLFIVGSVFLALRSREVLKIAVANMPESIRTNLKSDSSEIIFNFDPAADSVNYDARGYDGILYMTRDSSHQSYSVVSKKQIGIESMENIRRQMSQALEADMLRQKGLNKATLDSISAATENAVSVDNKIRDKSGKTKEANAGLAYGVGFGSGILIYITMFIFGAMVMRGVMEEKMNRIAEVMVSSVKPFQLMMGKIIGIAAVGLTQFFLWFVLIVLLLTLLPIFIPGETLQEFQRLQESQQELPGGSNNSMALKLLQAKSNFVGGIDWTLIIACFLFYFLFGYLFYAALFAAVGSVVNEDPQEAQSLMLPITMPIILAFVILSTSVSNPGSPTAFWGSLIPFTSPIVMMGRVANGVPEAVAWWELFLSMALLVLGFIFTTWFAAKVYRTGILMYGKKATWREMFKWLRRG